jgi:hypothetical protein
LRDELLGLGGQAPELALGAVVVELGEDTILGVRIQPQPGYARAVRHGVDGWMTVRLVRHNEPHGLFG